RQGACPGQASAGTEQACCKTDCQSSGRASKSFEGGAGFRRSQWKEIGICGFAAGEPLCPPTAGGGDQSEAAEKSGGDQRQRIGTLSRSAAGKAAGNRR